MNTTHLVTQLHGQARQAVDQSIFKKPPRAETHKPISVSLDTHRRLLERQLNMQFSLRRKVSLDEVVAALLEVGKLEGLNGPV